MSQSPKLVRRIEPNRRRSFDQEFWPVLLALGVLCSIAIGAALTLLRGPWMWGSLLFLPATAALAIYLLYRLDDSRLRRSLQMAILLSLAAHLLVLIFASATNIFQNEFQLEQPRMAKRQPKTITVRNRQSEFAWEQPNLRETPEPEVEVRREQTTTQPTPQPVPVESSQPTPKPQVTKRETTSQSVPRMDKELSQMRRQTRNSQPQPSSSAATALPQSTSQPASDPAAAAAASAAATNRQTAASQPARASARPSPANTPSPANPSRTSQRANRAAAAANQPSQPAPESTAQVRRTRPRLPRTEPRQVVTQPTPQPPTQTARSRPEPSRSSSEVTRRERVEPTNNPSPTTRPRTVASPRNSVARTAERRPQPPTLSRPQATPQVPRRSSQSARTPTTTRVAEAPSNAPSSNSESRQLTARAVSMSRGESGAVGATRQNNLQTGTGGQVSPAQRASDSAVRRRTEQAPATNQLLTSSQMSSERRSVAQANAPATALRANTANMARLTGSSQPSERTLQASAASNQTSAAAPTGEISVQRGESVADVGPTKIVAGRTAERRSGGGQPDVGSLNLESTANESRRSSERTPTLSAAVGPQTTAPTSPTASPAGELETQPASDALTHARAGAEQSMSYDRGAAQAEGLLADSGAAATRAATADSRQRANREVAFQPGDADEDEEERLTGNSRSRVALAPRINSQTNAGEGVASQVANPTATGSGELSLADAAGDVQRAAATAQPTGGGMEAAVAANGSSSQSATQLASRRDSNQSARGDQVAPQASAGQRRSRSRTAQPAVGTSSQVNLNASAPAGNVGAGQASAGLKATRMSAQRNGEGAGARLDIAAPEGPAGLGQTPAPSVGVRTRPASRDSDQLLPDVQQRFRSRDAGGTPAVNPNAIVARDAFRTRNPSSVGSAEPSTEAAIQAGLEFLVRHQNEDGSWSLQGFDAQHSIHQDRQLKSDSAATGLALLAFQGAGYTHKEFKYASQVQRGIQSLLANQLDNGCLFRTSGSRSDDSCRMYSHAIATLALCEAYGMTQDPELKEPTQRALRWIVETQDPSYGGWRYYADRARRSTDTSVTGWMLMALQSARLAGLEVSQETLDPIYKWLDLAVDPDRPSQYRYNPYAVNSDAKDRSSGRRATPSMTAVGLLMQIYGDLEKSSPVLLDGARSLLEQLPSDNDSVVRDTYYWYYATQVLKHVDGDEWEAWNSRLHPLLVGSQVKDGEMAGSWNPYTPVPDRWGVHAGRLYVTTMNLLSLEVRYRLLPLYEETLR